MHRFHFRARDSQGNIVEGSVLAKTEERASSILKSSGYHLENIEIRPAFLRFLDSMDYLELETVAIELLKDATAHFSRVPWKIIALFMRQIAVLYRSGITLKRTLEVLKNENWPLPLSRAVDQIDQCLNMGISLHLMMQKFPHIFPKSIISIVAVGETSGKLAQALDRASLLAEEEAKLHMRVSSALVYPVFLLFISFGVMGLIMFFLLPKLYEILSASDVKTLQILHMTLKSLHYLSNPLILLILIELLILLWILYYIWARTTEGRVIADRLYLKIPYLKDFLIKIHISRLSFNLWMLTDSGVTLLEALSVLPQVIGNESLAQTVTAAKKEVIAGLPLSEAMGVDPRFPRIFIQMLKVGEQSGNLSECLVNANKLYAQETELAVASFLGVFEPLIVILMGFFVGAMLMTFFPVIYELSKGIGI